MLRRKKYTAEGGVDLGIIITPMLDMAFQLLAFFIMTYHPSPSEAAVDGTLLQAAQGHKGTANAIASLQIVVKSEPAGQPTALYLKRPRQGAQLIARMQEPGNSASDFSLALQ